MTVDSVELRSTVGSGCVLRVLVDARQPAREAASSRVPVNAGSLCRMRLVPNGIGGRKEGHAYAEVGSGKFPVDDLDGATMRVHELEHHGKTDARPLDLHSGGRAAGVERFENARALFLRNAGARVGHVDHELRI